MFCFHCGASLPEGTKLCEQCGTDLSDTKASAPIVPEEAPAIPPVKEDIPVKKASEGPAGFGKPLRIAITVTMILSLLLILASGLIMLGTNVTEMGIVTWSMDTFLELDLQEELDGLSEARRSLKTKYNNEFSTLSKTQHSDLKEMIAQIETVQEDNSVLKLIRFLDYLVGQSEKSDDADEQLYSIDTGNLQDFRQTKIILFVVMGLAYLLPLLFALLAGLLKKTGLTVTALILTCLVQVITGAMILFVISLAVYLLQILFCGLLKTVKAAA